MLYLKYWADFWLEFLLLGGLAGVLAGSLTMLAANLLGYYMFDLTVSLNPWLIILGALVGAVLVASAAWLNLRSLLRVAPMVLLKTSPGISSGMPGG